MAINNTITHLDLQRAADIIAAFNPWTLCCALGAENGTIGLIIGFDVWLQLSEKNWMPEVQGRLNGVDVKEIEQVLRNFVFANRHKDCLKVMRDIEKERGLNPAPVLGPGESMTVRL